MGCLTGNSTIFRLDIIKLIHAKCVIVCDYANAARVHIYNFNNNFGDGTSENGEKQRKKEPYRTEQNRTIAIIIMATTTPTETTK